MRIFALTDDQVDSLLRFLEADMSVSETGREEHQLQRQDQRPVCPLPVIGDNSNLRRVDPDLAIPEHRVFMDRWERKV